jgi:hypothetical protein
MSHRLHHNPETDCIELTIEGAFDMERLRRIAPEVARLSEQRGCRRILNDMSGATITLAISGLYDSPQQMDAAGVSRATRRALVVPPDFTQAPFLETVTRNRGHNLRIFTDREQALTWLLRS